MIKLRRKEGSGEDSGLFGFQLSYLVFSNMEVRIWGGENVVDGGYYIIFFCYLQIEDERKGRELFSIV